MSTTQSPRTLDPAVSAPEASGNARAAGRWSAALMNNFGVPPIELVSGHGAIVVDADGREYLDLLGGIAVNALGHAHPAVVQAVSRADRHARARLQLLHPPDGVGTGRAIARPGQRDRRRAGDLLQFRRRGQRGGVQDRPAHRPAADHRHPRRFPRPDHGRAGADRSARQAGAVRADDARGGVRTVRRRRGAVRRGRRDGRGGVPRADPGRGRRHSRPGRLPRRTPGRSPPTPARCWCSTRCRPGSAAPEPGSPTSAPGSGRT